MNFRAIRVALLLSVLPAAGCGTVSNVVSTRPEAGGKTPFGGVRRDLWCIQKASGGEWGGKAQPKAESERYPSLALMALCAADLPFSLVGDIVTWPYTASYSFINEPIPTPPVTLVAPLPAAQTPPGTDGLPGSTMIKPMTIPVPPTNLPVPQTLPPLPKEPMKVEPKVPMKSEAKEPTKGVTP